MMFSVTFEFFNLKNRNLSFLWEMVIIHKLPIFQTKSNETPMFWSHIRTPHPRLSFRQIFILLNSERIEYQSMFFWQLLDIKEKRQTF